ncbi:winged helix-turn-helix domain-containing protein, partial [Acinetobacter junii]
MPVPKYHELTLPMLKYLKMQTEAVTIADIKNTLAIQLSLTDEDLAQRLPSGLNMFSDRLSWAKTYLLKAGLIEQPKRAFCQISELGNSIDLSN